MKTINDILNVGNDFINAHKKANERFEKWQNEKFELVLQTLSRVKEVLESNNDYFRSNLYINKDENKTLITLRSGQNAIPLSGGESESFSINFWQISNGKIYVFMKPSKSNQDFNDINLGIIDDIQTIDESIVIDFVYQGILEAKNYSSLFIADNEEK